MFNKRAFHAKVVAEGLTFSAVAVALGINPGTLGRKMSGESDFTRAEIQKLRNILGMSCDEAERIFFSQ